MHNTWLYFIQRKIYYKQSLIVVFFLFLLVIFFSQIPITNVHTKDIRHLSKQSFCSDHVVFYLNCPLKALWNYKGFMFFLCNALMLLVNIAFCNSYYSSVSFLMESQCINYTTFPLSYVYNYLGVTLQVCMYKSKFLHLKEFKKKTTLQDLLSTFRSQYISGLNRKTEGLLLHEL